MRINLIITLHGKLPVETAWIVISMTAKKDETIKQEAAKIEFEYKF